MNFRGQRGLKKIELNKRFWSKIDIRTSDECWNYKEGKFSNGYGQFWTGNKNMGAHKFAYESFHKINIPKNISVLHHCDNPACCNPKHLYLGNQSDNMQDKFNRLRCLGSRVRFYAGEIWLIRRLGKARIYQNIIAKMFKVNRGTISNILTTDRYACKEGFYT